MSVGCFDVAEADKADWVLAEGLVCVPAVAAAMVRILARFERAGCMAVCIFVGLQRLGLTECRDLYEGRGTRT